tara:strand:- start:183 stop:500 length:318 start_codon:yes stop_codon:yes gene_type:complete
VKKLWKYIIGFFTFFGGIFLSMLVLGSKKNKRVKELKNKIKDNEKKTKKINKSINTNKKKNTKLKKDINKKTSKVKNLKSKKKNIKIKDASASDAADFLKSYKKK